MRRRAFIAAGLAAAAAGCTVESSDDGNGDSENGLAAPVGDVTAPEERAEMDFSGESITVATYDSFVDATSDSPGGWIKEEFESEYDATLEWAVPDQELTHYVERQNQGRDIEAEAYLGVRPQNLVRADRTADSTLFREADVELLRNGPDIGDEYFFDPHDRAVPTFLSHCAVVYDGRNVPEPETFEDLTSDTYEGKIAVPNPSGTTTGLLFLLWTINEFGSDGYLDYWQDLLDNDIRILDSWNSVYTQFQENEMPVVVSFSNDRVFAKRFGNSLEKHRVALLNGQGYANLAGVGRFADSEKGDLTYEFMDFVLEPRVQAAIAEQNVTGPVNETAEPPDVFQEYAKQPDETVFYGYDELEGNLEGWVDDLSREIAN